MKPARCFAWILALGLLAYASSVRADNWPQWRGPNIDGICHEKDLPIKWNESENVAWRTELPGQAGATPVVWGDRIFLTSARDNGDLLLLCLDTSGKILWEQGISSGNQAVRKDEGNYASPSPCTDGKFVWTFMGTGELACFNVDGQPQWKFNVAERYGKLNIAFGMTSTPVLDGDRLYLQLLHTNAALVICLDKLSGKEIWKHVRTSDAHSECLHSYASPIMYRDSKQSYLITHGCDYVIAHNLKDGSEIWRCGGMNPKGKYNPTLRFVASPAAAPGLIVVPTAKNGPVLALSPNVKGDISNSDEGHFWTRLQNTPDVPSPLIHDGLVYLCRENGVLICMDAKTGEELYQTRIFSDRYRASPVYADGNIYLTSRKGVVTVVKAGRTFQEVSVNNLEEEISASPAFSNGKIYLRSFDALYCIENGKTLKSAASEATSSK
jgi:outer membrane protein assembly factor BamB